jgi:DNA-binding CsgD family transcriptional regulator
LTHYDTSNRRVYYARLVGSETGAFVGRERELTALLELGARVARRGGPAVAFVLGDPGSGKSRLLTEAADRIRLRHQWRIVGFEPARHVPLAAASDLLRAITDAPRDGPRLRELLYEVPAASGRLEPLRVFEAAHRALRAFGPSLIIADDLQWADEQTLTLCHYLMRAAHSLSQSLGLIVAYRTGPNANALQASLEQLLPRENRVTIELEPLSRIEGVRLASQLAPGLAAERAEAVWQRAGGSPFWIEALVRSSASDPNLSNVVSARLHGVSEDATTLFAVQCVLGRPLGQLELGLLLGWEPSRIHGAAGQLINHGVVVLKGASLALAHDLIREAAVRQLPLSERRRIHRQVAAWLEGEAGDDVRLLRLALEHRRGAGLPATDLALRLVSAPNRGLLGTGGLRDLGTIADEAEPGAQTLALRQHVASFALELGSWMIALDRFASLSEENSASPLDRAQAAYGAARAAYELKRAEEAHVYLARCLNTDDPVLRMEAEVLEAQTVGWIQNRIAEGRTRAAGPAAAARRLVEAAGGVDRLTTSQRRAVVSGLRLAFDAALWDDDVPKMLTISDELIEAARTLGDVPLTATLQADYFCLVPMGRFREAQIRSGRVLDEARRHVMPVIVATAAFNLAVIHFACGRLVEARSLATEALELSERGVLPPHYSPTQVRQIFYRIGASQRDWRRELGLLADVLAAEPNPHSRTLGRRELARWLARFGSTQVADQVSRHVTAHMEEVQAAGCERCHWEGLLAAIEAYARVGLYVKAQECARQWDARYPDPHPWYRFLRNYAEALLVARAREIESAIPLFEAALVDAERMSALHEALWVQLDLGEALSTIDRERAIVTLQGAAGVSQALGSASAHERASAVLRSLGVRTWRRTADSPEGPLSELSAREREILRLVTEGASNPEIASAVFISRKTVEHHVSNILRKLGVRNRTELTSAVGPHMREFTDDSAPAPPLG